MTVREIEGMTGRGERGDVRMAEGGEKTEQKRRIKTGQEMKGEKM